MPGRRPHTRGEDLKWFGEYKDWLFKEMPTFYKNHAVWNHPGREMPLDVFQFETRVGIGVNGDYFCAKYKYQPDDSERLYNQPAVTEPAVGQEYQFTMRQFIRERLTTLTLKAVPVFERTLLSGIQSEFIIALYGRCRDAVHLFTVLEYAPYGDLTRLAPSVLGDQDKLSEKQLSHYMIQIAFALQHLHLISVIHRDVRPSNCLIFNNGRVKLSDFVCATQSATPSGQVGTPAYSAPDMLEELPYRKEVDWWSFGVTIYKLITDNLPFDGDYWSEIRTEILTADAVNLEGLGFTPDGKDLLSKLLKKRPEERLGYSELQQDSGMDVVNHKWFSEVQRGAIVKSTYQMDGFKLGPIRGEPVAPTLYHGGPAETEDQWEEYEWY